MKFGPPGLSAPPLTLQDQLLRFLIELAVFGEVSLDCIGGMTAPSSAAELI